MPVSMRMKHSLALMLGFLAIVGAGSLGAQHRKTQSHMAPQAASGPPATYVEPFGAPVAPPLWLANFMILYASNPENAANMPAYRAPLPQEVYECLVENPEGCSYPEMAKYFAEQALEIGGSRNKNTFWPPVCQTDPRWQALAPPLYRQPDQINQPLGRERADQLARLLGIDQEMILTEEQYRCEIGTPPRDPAREIIAACTYILSNSKGNAIIPLSSYGLNLDARGEVRSNCAPRAPCLVFNKLVYGPLEKIAAECGFTDKVMRLNDPTRTPLLEFLRQGVNCQREWGPEGDPPRPACIVETTCPGNGAQSNNNCAPSSAAQ